MAAETASRFGARRTRRAVPHSGSDFFFTLATAGDMGVGKTCLVLALAGKPVAHGYAATVGVDVETATLALPTGKVARLQAFDTAGQEQYRESIAPTFLRRRDAYVLVYDVTALDSLTCLTQAWVPLLASLAKPGVGVLLVGNKVDALPLDGAADAAALGAEAAAVAECVAALEAAFSPAFIHHARVSALQGTGVQEAGQALAQGLIDAKL